MKYYVSFGQMYNLRNSFMVFEDKTEEEIRIYMSKVYDNKYAFIYPEEEALRQIPLYGLNLVKPGTALEVRGY